ncbi:MAG: cytochrome bd-I oxidase subunit CydX [Alphaproteobacteria bacterium]|nr:cytochrome bd-I oxidase subunit CydX [Alphaproteobacteria bacterium]MDE2337182.1 cytochrome bd-I oxidase subunit CydX [Alphaproteobacteria bacterium]
MWYFTWILGLAMMLMFGVLNAMWLDIHIESDSA